MPWSNSYLILACMYAGYLADLNGSVVNDIGEFHWDFETSLNGNVSFTHAAVLSGSRHCVLSVLRGHCRYVILQDTQASTRRNTHPLTPILIIGHPLSTSSIYYDPQHHLCSVYVLDSPLWQHLSRSSWSSTLYFILHAFLHRVIIFVSQHMPIPTQPVLL